MASSALKFECPVCYERIFPPIYQCRNGHLVCQDCVEKLKQCPSCRAPMTGHAKQIRNLELEKIIRAQVHPCPHEGCQKNLQVDVYTEHKKNCEYRNAAFCSLLRLGRCDEETTLNKLAEHLLQSHAANVVVGGIVSKECVAFEVTFDQGFRGIHSYICWVTGRKNKSESFPVVLVESWKTSWVHWSVIILASPAFVERFAYDLRILPASNTLAPADAPLIHYKGSAAQCPECEAWGHKDDFCAKINQLKRLVKAGDGRQWYLVKLRLHDKNQKRYYTFQSPGPSTPTQSSAPATGNSTVAEVPAARSEGSTSVDE